jgi:hypothetical protein
MYNTNVKYLCENGHYHTRDEMIILPVTRNNRRVNIMHCKGHKAQIISKYFICQYPGCNKMTSMSLKGVAALYCSMHKKVYTKYPKSVTKPILNSSETGWDCIKRKECLLNTSAESLHCDTCANIQSQDTWKSEVVLTVPQDYLPDLEIYE